MADKWANQKHPRKGLSRRAGIKKAPGGEAG
jgi:hypothetical protein